MKRLLLCINFFICLGSMLFAQTDKIYIKKNNVFIPNSKDKYIPLLYKCDISDGLLLPDDESILMVGMTKYLDYKLRYCLHNKILITYSMYESRRDIGPAVSLGIRVASLKKSSNELYKVVLEGYKKTMHGFNDIILMDHGPIRAIRPRAYPFGKMRFDFASDEEAFYLTTLSTPWAKERTDSIHHLKVWQYNIPPSGLVYWKGFTKDQAEQPPQATLLKQYTCELTESFITFHIGGCLYLITTSGKLYQLDGEMVLLKDYEKDLDVYSLVIDKDKERVHLLERALIQEGTILGELIQSQGEVLMLK